MRVAIFGCGGMGRELADIVRRDVTKAAVFVADESIRTPVDGLEVITPEQLTPADEIVIALGDSSARRSIAERLFRSRFATIVSPTALISPSARMGAGTVVCDFAVINNGTVVGRHFQANCFAQVSHDCIIGDFVTFAPHVSCNGWVTVEDDVFVGAGAVIRNGRPHHHLRIGRGAVIGMGAVITADVPAGAVVYGNPATARL